MSKDQESGSMSSPGTGPSQTAAPTPIEYSKAPSMLWFVVPMALLMAYGYFSR